MADTEKKTDADTEAEERVRYEIEVAEIGPCKVELRIKVPVETIKEELDERFAEIKKTVQFDGFRIGHAPHRLIEKRLGDDVRNDVKEHVLTESFKEAIEKNDLDPISEPDVDLDEVDFDPEKPMEYQASLVVRPTVAIPEYKELSVKAVKPEIDDERVKEVIGDLRRQHAVLEAAPDGKMGDGDVAVVDVVARVGDEKLIDRENAQYQHPQEFLVGLQLAAVKDEILGKSAGDEFTLTEVLPDTWPQEEQAGKEMTVEVKVQEVKRHRLPELDQAFAEELDYDTVEELEEEVRDQVEREAERAAAEATDRLLVDALIEAAPFELPEDVVKEETKRRLDRTQAALRMKSAGEEEVETKLAEARNAERAEVEREFRSGFLMDAIAKAEKVFVTEDEIEERVAAMAAGYHRSAEEMQDYLEQRGLMSSVRGSMREEKVMEILRKKVKIEE